MGRAISRCSWKVAKTQILNDCHYESCNRFASLMRSAKRRDARATEKKAILSCIMKNGEDDDLDIRNKR